MSSTSTLRTVPLSSLPSYADAAPSSRPSLSDAVPRTSEVAGLTQANSPFPVNALLNSRLACHYGSPAYTLECAGLLLATNEAFTERSGIIGDVWRLIGRDLEVQCRKADKVRTGEVVVTTSSTPLTNLSHVLHTVGPRYNEQYKTAAENALHFCYRNALRVAKEEGIRTLALTCIYTRKKRYPRVDAAHIVARTVRRFLEKWHNDVDLIVFTFEEDEDAKIYDKVLPLYFPRTPEEEEYARENLPEDVGNEDGETVIKERKIRINSFPIAPSASRQLFDNKAPVSYAFAGQEALISTKHIPPVQGYNTMVPDQDEVRRQAVQKQLKSMTAEQRSALRYERLLRDSRAEDLSDIAALGFIYKSGRDINGRTIVVIVARHLPAQAVDMNRVLLYIVRVMDSIVEKEYSIVYVHSNMQTQNQPELAWMQEVTSIFNRKYKKNLMRFFVVHPTFWVKMVFWTLTPIISNKFWTKLTYISELSELEKYLEINKLGLPAEVKEADRQRSGSSAVPGGASAPPPPPGGAAAAAPDGADQNRERRASTNNAPPPPTAASSSADQRKQLL